MPFYSDDLIEEVRQSNDIVDVISNYVQLKRKGSSYFGLCPFHNEKTGSFSVSPSKQMYYCFGCGAGGNVFTFLMQYENFSFREAMEYLADRANIELPKYEMTQEQKMKANEKAVLLEINKEAAKYFYTLLRSLRGELASKYFEKRQLTPETMRKFGLGYSDQYSDDLYKYLKQKGYTDEILKESGLITIKESKGVYDRFWNRAMFPIMDAHNKVIGFGGRVMGDGEPKYLNSPETKVFDKGRNLYGLNFARASRRDYLLLCEGYMDVISLHQAGFDNAVASLGTALTSGHASLLKRYTKEVYLTYDSDGAGIKAALRAIPILKEVGISTKVVNMKPYKDPDEFIKNLGAEEYENRIREAENSFMFEVRVLQQDYDLNDPDGKTRYFQEVAKKLLGFSEELERNNYIEAIAKKYQVSYDDLRKMVVNMAIKLGGYQKPKEIRNSQTIKKQKEDGMRQSQKLMLTWLIEDDKLYPVIKDYISFKDFTEELYSTVATEVFKQYEENGSVNAARIISTFESEEEQREVASLFNAKIQKLSSKSDKEKALKETIIRIKQNSISVRSNSLDPTDLQSLMDVLNDKKELEKIEKMQFSL